MPHFFWFAVIDGNVVGPLSAIQLQVLIERGWVRAETPIRHERMSHTVPAAEVQGLAPVVRSTTTPCDATLVADGWGWNQFHFGVRDIVLFVAGVACALLIRVMV